MPAEKTVILVCDDQEIGRYTKVRPLRHAGYLVIEAATGAEALRLVTEQRPALAVLDVKLPDMSGLEVTAIVKRDFPGTFVLQTSASFVSLDDRIRGLDEGADAYLVQPMEPRELVASVRALLRIRQAEDDLRASQAAQRDSEGQFMSLANSIPQLAWMADREGGIFWYNERWYDYTGTTADEMAGWGWQSVHDPEVLPAVMERWTASIASGEAFEMTFPLRGADGVYRPFLTRVAAVRDDLGQIVRWFGTNTDVTEQHRAAEVLEHRVMERTAELTAANAGLILERAQREQAQEALRQAQKMEAVGQLTGGIAHDFNNLLTGISGNIELLQKRLGAGRTDVDRYADAAMTATTRAAALTQRLLAFARRQALDPKPVDINKLVVSLEDMLRRTVGELVKIEVNLAGGLWAAHCDTHQLENALINLVINARDAMPEGGRISLETENADLDEAYAASQDGVEPGEYVALCVTDTGTGMPASVMARVFEPFFTTKPIGQGTGLGLSMLYGFIKQSGGHVRIFSEPGQGTIVKLYLPRYRGSLPAYEAVIDELKAPAAERGETVLVVEDELMVRTLILNVLNDLNYASIEAVDGPSALRVLESKARIDLLVTDVGLPGMNGRQLADRARELRPGLRVLFVTGYAHNAEIADALLEPGMELITKPFPLETLAKKVGAMIAEARLGE